MVPLKLSGLRKTIERVAVQRKQPVFVGENETHWTARAVPLHFCDRLLGLREGMQGCWYT